MGLIDRLKSKFEQVHIEVPHHDHKPPIKDERRDSAAGTINKKAIYKNRYNYAVNLGSLFVLESWIYNDVFEAGGNSEYEAVNNLVTKQSYDSAVGKLREHYNNYMNKIDWNWLQHEAGATALRVPIGYWHVDNGKLLGDLPFSTLANVYEAARPWDVLKDLIRKAAEHNIGILIDIHGLPGGANGDAHSGIQNGTPSFFGTEKYVNKVCNDIIPFIVRDVCIGNDNVIGLQVVNEATFSNDATHEKAYYLKAFQIIHEIDNTLPVVISDGWWPDQWADWVQQNNLQHQIVIDSHVYRAFSEEDKAKTADQIIADVPRTVNFPRDRADFMVGEFSCVLSEETWQKTPGNRDDHVRAFGNVLTQRFAQVASWGWFFWTLQFQWGDGGEWGFVPMINKGCIPRNPARSLETNEDALAKMLEESRDAFEGDKPTFEHAFKKAIADTKTFDEFNHSQIGRWTAWVNQQKQIHGGAKKDDWAKLSPVCLGKDLYLDALAQWGQLKWLRIDVSICYHLESQLLIYKCT
ncbi:17-beta-hydroxysteroid dehydrogenase-like protein KNAG_0J00880 [Huiozyma naganishii CBS 8797]|uniref:Glycoside hydrolase family 5 domain-containing protein n=1 Tax=Huiozyma naganishii (strain ATCC MYA-139 / BCRC 22969 / CBS 8797 / KCTC 17520 / NBRC 10181 / NCYC 3082 / Yp74L-3) TaxID=1071383 RepID=J7RBB8_HUIN7|nr:hypothetical protein KNAG_0J00880 [Kazachstania naganishii CBS 8797]CCK72170.1 hypothetical protein KNAG_0J00880 [Kazachstania naganishii CBS 8797]